MLSTGCKLFAKLSSERVEIMAGQLVAVLDVMYSRPVEFVDFLVSNVEDRRHTASLVKILATLHPLGQYQHLKRVRSTKTKDAALQILLCPAESQNDGDVEGDTNNGHVSDIGSVTDVLENTGLPVSALSKPYLVKVPRHPPATRKQYEEASLFWPVTFHEDKAIARLMSGHFFTQEEVKKVKGYLLEADAMAETALRKGQEGIGVVIVDPEREVTVAKGHDLRKGGNPLLHAVMVGVDLVAKSQGGGMWGLTDADFCVRTEEKLNDNTDLDQSVADDSMSDKEKVGPYLCTAYDVYLTQEPCPMCCMALVHSRVGRVFYTKPHTDGGLGSRYKIHVQNGLNHHFSVFQWKGPLKQDHDDTDIT